MLNWGPLLQLPLLERLALAFPSSLVVHPALALVREPAFPLELALALAPGQLAPVPLVQGLLARILGQNQDSVLEYISLNLPACSLGRGEIRNIVVRPYAETHARYTLI